MPSPNKAASPRRRRWRRRVSVALLLYAISLALIAAGCSDRLILYPTTAALDPTGLQRHEARMPDGGMIEIWSAQSPGSSSASTKPKAYVLSFIGNAARAELTAPFFAKDWGDRPVEVWAVNYPGYGGSPGSAQLNSIAPAALAAYDALAHHAKGRPIFLEARSIGTTAALHVAAHRQVAGCILHNPPPLRQLIVGRYGWWNLWLFAGPISVTVPSDLDSLANGARAKAPAVFLIADADSVVPAKYQQRVADSHAGEKRVIHSANAGHTARVSGPALAEYEASLDWLWHATFPADPSERKGCCD